MARLYAKASRIESPIMSSIARWVHVLGGRALARLAAACRASSPTRRRPGRRVYADVNVVNPASYWDYENLNIEWG